MRFAEMRISLGMTGLAIVVALVAGCFLALAVRSVVAGPDSGPAASPPNPGHSWSEIGDLPGTMWHSNNDGSGSGLDADTLDGLQSTEIQDADDCDGFTTDDEVHIGTDPLDACPDALDDDAWPPDINGPQACGTHNGQVNILDVLCYEGKLSPNPYEARYDLNADEAVNILDVLLYKWVINTSCTNP